MRKHNPSHLGEVLEDLYLEPLGLNVAGMTEAFGVFLFPMGRDDQLRWDRYQVHSFNPIVNQLRILGHWRQMITITN